MKKSITQAVFYKSQKIQTIKIPIMINKHLIIILSFFTLLVCGCATTVSGSDYISEEQRISSLISEKSNKRDVYYSIGQPTLITTEENNNIWSYVKVTSSVSKRAFIPLLNIDGGGQNYLVEIIDLNFNKNGILAGSKSNFYEVEVINSDFRDFDLKSAENNIKSNIEKVRSGMKSESLPFDEKSLKLNLGLYENFKHQIKKNETKRK